MVNLMRYLAFVRIHNIRILFGILGQRKQDILWEVPLALAFFTDCLPKSGLLVSMPQRKAYQFSQASALGRHACEGMLEGLQGPAKIPETCL